VRALVACALALYAAASPGIARATPYPVGDAVGVVWQSSDPGPVINVLNFTPHYGINQPHADTSGHVAHFYLLFYNYASGTPWTAAQMSYFEGLFSASGVGNPAIMNEGQDYPIIQVPGGDVPNFTSGTFGKSYVDNNGEGPGCVGNAALTNAISGSHLPDDHSGIYIFLPSASVPDHCGSGSFNYMGTNDSIWVTIGRPFLDQSWDNLVGTALFEAWGGVWSASPRWFTTGSFAQEVHEACAGYAANGENKPCENGPVIYPDPTDAGGSCILEGTCDPNVGRLANYSWVDDAGVTQYVALPCTWYRHQQVNWPDPTNTKFCGFANRCNCTAMSGYADFFSTACRSDSDCPAPSMHCGGEGHCAPPTCVDGVQNLNELGPDIGGWCFSRPGQPCHSGLECRLNDAGVYVGQNGSCVFDGGPGVGPEAGIGTCVP
jgi:hypothetical protein